MGVPTVQGRILRQLNGQRCEQGALELNCTLCMLRDELVVVLESGSVEGDCSLVIGKVSTTRSLP